MQTGPAGRSGRRAALGRSLRAAADLVWPADCAGCGRELAGPLCPACRLALLGPVRRREQAAPRLTVPGGPALPVWSAAWYSDEVRRGIVAWKRQGRGELELEMRRAIARTAEAAGRVLAAVSPRLAVVPVPSRLVKRLSRRVSRRAGGTAVLALAAAEALAGAGLEAAYADVLTRSAASREQAGRSLRERALGREGTTGVSRLPAAPCLLVDDVLTTGATLLDAERALARAGGQTLGAVVLAVSPARSGDIGGPAGRMS